MQQTYTPVIGQKFYPDGSVRDFPGNTVICFVNPNSATYQQASWVQKQLQDLPFASKFTLLPPSSFHMTVIQLLCDQERSQPFWSSELPLDAPLEQTDAFFMKTVPTVPAPVNFRMKYWKLKTWGTSVNILLEPADEATRQSLQLYRDAISVATGIRFPDHDVYVFHISLAYQILELKESEATQLAQFAQSIDQTLLNSFGVFEAGKPLLTFFDNMFQFVPIDENHTLKTRS